VLNELARDCLEEFMEVLVPQPATVEVRLAAGEWYAMGSRDLRRGIRLAKQGRWDEAEELWEQVLKRSPANHAALYNLAVAAGQRQDFAAAEEYALQALREHHTDCYAQGLDQLRQFRADADRIARQRQAQVIQASLTAWQE
jgi:tetratricopeptide (TPR) repeat protein